jgi:hypothetical protein
VGVEDGEHVRFEFEDDFLASCGHISALLAFNICNSLGKAIEKINIELRGPTDDDMGCDR